MPVAFRFGSSPAVCVFLYSIPEPRPHPARIRGHPSHPRGEEVKNNPLSPLHLFPDLSGSILRPACTKKKRFHIDLCCFCDIIKEKTKKDEDYGIVTVKKYREIDAK